MNKQEIAEENIVYLKKWWKIRNFLTHESDDEIIPYYEEYKSLLVIIIERLDQWKNNIEQIIGDV